MKNKENFYQIFLAFFVILLFPVFYLALWVSSGMKEFPWDGNWYRSIALEGYSFNGDIASQNNVAFLPGYPVVIYLFSFFFGENFKLAQLFSSLLSYVIGCVFYFFVLREKLSELAAIVFIVVFSANPYSIYLFNGYSESLFFCLSGCFFYLLNKKSFFLAALVVSFSLITRPHAIALAILFSLVVFYETYKKNSCDEVFGGGGVFLATFFPCRYFPAVMLFPCLLTGFFYFRFNDSLIYANALNAWSVHSPEMGFLEFIDALAINVFHDLKKINFGDLSISFLGTEQFSAVTFFLQLISLFILLFLFFKKEDLRVLIGFCVLLAIFCFYNKSVVNLGRHYVMLFSIPLCFACFFDFNFRKSVAGWRGELIFAFLVFFMCFVYVSFGLLHFFIYSLLQIGGRWIS